MEGINTQYKICNLGKAMKLYNSVAEVVKSLKKQEYIEFYSLGKEY